MECKDKKQSLALNKKEGITTLGWDYYEHFNHAHNHVKLHKPRKKPRENN